MSDDDASSYSSNDDDPPIDVAALIEIEKEKRCIKAAKVKFRKEVALRDRVNARLKKEKKEKRLAAQKKRKERENKIFQQMLEEERVEPLKDQATSAKAKSKAVDKSIDSPVKKKPARKQSRKKKLVPPPGNSTMKKFLIDLSKTQSQTQSHSKSCSQSQSQSQTQDPQSLKSPDAASFTEDYATPPTVPKEVDTSLGMTCYSVISSSAASAKTSATATTCESSCTGSKVDMS